MNNTYCFSPAGFKLQVIAALVASAISGGVQAQATVNTTGGTENDVAVNVNTDDQSAGAFIVYSGSGTTNVMASIGALTGTTFRPSLAERPHHRAPLVANYKSPARESMSRLAL